MLATLPRNPAPMADVSNMDPQASAAYSDASFLAESRICPGCKQSVVNENGGVVVAFGQSFFHVDCFKCAKCGNQVTADTNLLLLSDGSPICANCSYSCNVCHLPILDEAIMTGDDSYHAHCFKCKVCKNRIDELVFAKTSQGIYCMDCHNQRVARSRRHAQRQREKEREKERQLEQLTSAGAASANSSANSRDDLARNQQVNESLPQISSTSQSPSDLYSPDSTGTSPREETNQVLGQSSVIRTSDEGSGSKRGSKSSVTGGPDQAQDGQDQTSQNNMSGPVPGPILSIAATLGSALSGSKRPSTMPISHSPVPSVRYSSPAPPTIEQSDEHARSVSSPLSTPDNLSVPSALDGSLHSRKSFDGGVHALNSLLRSSPSALSLNLAGGSTSNGSPTGLEAPGSDTSRRQKRRSINPAIALSYTHSLPNSGITSASSQGRESPRTSPFREFFSPPHALFSPSHADGSTSSPRVASPAPRAGTPSSVRGSSDYFEHHAGRTRPGSSGTSQSVYTTEYGHGFRTPSRASATLDRFPSRPSSRAEQSPTTSQENAHEHSHPDAHRLSGRGHGHRPPSLNLNGRGQKQFDYRARASPSPSLRQLAGTRSSTGAELESPPHSSAPMSPAHRADVPHGIESGTDTEAESDENNTTEHSHMSDDLPPALPPKDAQPTRKHHRPPLLLLDTVDISDKSLEVGHVSSEEGNSGSPESSPVQRTSHATFIAPALPPIRISMGGTDFSDLLRSVDGNVLKLEQLAEATEDGGLKLDVTLVSPAVLKSRRNSTLTSRSDATVTDSIDSHPDDTPGRRLHDARQRDMEGRSRSGSLAQDRWSGSSPIASPVSLHRTLMRSSTESDGRRSTESLESDRRRAATDYAARSPSGLSQHQDTRSSLDVQPRSRTPSLPLNAQVNHDETHITVTTPDSLVSRTLRSNKADRVRRLLQDAVVTAAANDDPHVVLQLDLAEGLLELLDQRKYEYNDLKNTLDGAKRVSRQYMDGLTVAQTEYDRELKARRDAEAEVTRLRVLLSGQAVRLSAISSDSKRQEAQKQMSREMTDSVSTLEKTLSKLKVERDMTLAEVEQLSASRSSTTIVNSEDDAASMTRALSMRFDNIKNQYQYELLPLTEQREALMREIVDLKASRDAFLEETTMLNARNEELARLHAQYARRVEMPSVEHPDDQHENGHESGSQEHISKTRPDNALETKASSRYATLSSSVTSTTVAFTDETAESKFIKVAKPDISRLDMMDTHGAFKAAKFIKWPGTKTPKDNVVVVWPDAHKQPAGRKDHAFQQVSVLRVARCDHCGDKMWGSQFRCTSCNVAVHIRCVHHVNQTCVQQTRTNRDEPPLPIAELPPSMFGRDLVEQVSSDSRHESRLVPVIVEKCIDAVDTLALEYEGIYRKTGGSGQSKVITQLFERGDYQAFDLRDTDRFNDICSVTSVLKSYFRALPDPLLTYALHDKFIAAASIRDVTAKGEALTELVNELPREHYHTTRALMLHLHRISQRSDKNLMHARNLGVVFGPTLMRSRDPNAEFTDMAGKALSVEWLVENAPVVFEEPLSH